MISRAQAAARGRTLEDRKVRAIAMSEPGPIPSWAWRRVVKRYFFHIMDGRVSLDATGKQMANVWEVPKEAINRTAAYLAPLDPRASLRWSMVDDRSR